MNKISFKADHLDEFIKRSSKLNHKLEKDEEFGKEWEIGHTFFTEIVDIVKSMNSISLFVKSNNKFSTAKGPVNVLWNISIKPMLEAYCGNLDKEKKEEKLNKFAEIFLGKK